MFILNAHLGVGIVPGLAFTAVTFNWNCGWHLIASFSLVDVRKKRNAFTTVIFNPILVFGRM